MGLYYLFRTNLLILLLSLNFVFISFEVKAQRIKSKYKRDYPISRVVASYYWQGTKTANGERFNPYGMTAAHRTLPFGSRLYVCLQGCVLIRINDRGPFIAGRDLDLSLGAARAIGLNKKGVATVTIGPYPN